VFVWRRAPASADLYLSILEKGCVRELDKIEKGV
jgi:hypothetical protein